MTTWDERKKARFAHDWNNGKSLEDLAEKYRITVGAAKRARARFKLPPRRMSASEIIRVRVPKPMVEMLKARANRHRTTISGLVRHSIEDLLSPL